MTNPITFRRPTWWPDSVAAERLLACPGCSSIANVTIGMDAGDVAQSPAHCRACGYRATADGFRAFPTTVSHPGPVWLDAVDENGDAFTVRWGDQPASTITAVLTAMTEFWPGITVTIEGGPDGVTVATDEVWANVAGLSDAVAERLQAILGEPDTIA